MTQEALSHMPINPQKDTKIFINQDTNLFVSGERILYPTFVQSSRNRVSVAHDLACVKVDDKSIISYNVCYTKLLREKIVSFETIIEAYANPKISDFNDMKNLA